MYAAFNDKLFLGKFEKFVMSFSKDLHGAGIDFEKLGDLEQKVNALFEAFAHLCQHTNQPETHEKVISLKSSYKDYFYRVLESPDYKPYQLPGLDHGQPIITRN